MNRHEDELERRDIEIARKTTQVGVLEQRRDELNESLARALRDRGALYGLLAGAVKDGALSAEYEALAAKVLAALATVDQSRLADPCPFGRGHRADG